MNCQEFWNTLPDAGETHAHAAECAACAARLERRRQLAAGLKVLAGQMARQGAPSRVEAKLTRAFREQAGTPSTGRFRRGWIPVVTWAAAAAAVIAVGAFVVRQKQPEAVRPAPSRQIELAMVENSGLDAAAIEEGYLPLPGADQLPAAEEVTVLHVELPRSAMMQVGIEVSPEQADEPVRADVMVGGDGLARAVRFLDVTGSD